MADWYIAPDLAVAPGLTFSTIGTSGYGHSWAKAVKLSDFLATSGAAVNRADGDTFHFLSCNRPYAASLITFNWNKADLIAQGETIAGALAPMVIVGTRDWPWPQDGSTASSPGETVWPMAATGLRPTLKMVHFKHIKYLLTSSNNGSATDYGTVTIVDCVGTNSHGEAFTMQTKTDGRADLSLTRLRSHGSSGSAQRFWPNNSGKSVVAVDCFGDSEHQNDNPTFNNATPTSFINVKDSIPGVATVKAAATLTRVIAVNHAAGLSGAGYQQGDGLIFEENTGSITAKDILTFGNGDRGLDSKCGGTVVRQLSIGDGTAGAGHHLDTQPMSWYTSLMKVGARLTTAGSPTPSAAIQSSGWTKSFGCFFDCRPTAAQVAINAYGAYSGSVDPSKVAQSIPGGIHQGKVELTDCIVLVKTSVGATEQLGFSGASFNGRLGVAWGLTPSTAYSLKVRAVGGGVAGAYSGTVAYTTAAAGGDVTGPSTPTGFTAVAQSGGTQVLFTWAAVAEDAGTAIQGYLIYADFGDGVGYLPLNPCKSASPLTLDGFTPASAYNFKIAAFDANGNLSALSGAVAVTTSAGSTPGSSPSAPQNVGLNDGMTITHPTLVGLGKVGGGPSGGWDAPATGTAAYYEIATSAGTLLARVMTVPTAGSTPTLTKTRVLVVTS